MQEQPEPQWDTGWEAHRLRQMQEVARWPLIKKLEWLEQAHFVAISLAKSRKQPDQRAAGGTDAKPDHT